MYIKILITLLTMIYKYSYILETSTTIWTDVYILKMLLHKNEFQILVTIYTIFN